MTGWLIMIGLALLVGAGLWKFGRLPRAGAEFLGAALLLALAGYAWQGRPAQPGSPQAAKQPEMQPDSEFAKQRGAMLERFGTTAQWLDFADALHRMGSDQAAVTALKTGIRERPRDADLWVGLGNALVLHAGGLITPAARLAFGRAAEIAPDHPGPPYFLGLAYAQAGQLDRAAETWRGLLARGPANAPWRADLEERLAQLDAMQAPAR